MLPLWTTYFGLLRAQVYDLVWLIQIFYKDETSTCFKPL